MKELEEALTNMSLPDIRVDEFKRELRRDLLKAAIHNAPGHGWRVAFGLACTAAAVFVFISVLFVFKPEVPARLNAWAMRGSQPRTPANPLTNPQRMVDANDPALQAILDQGLTSNADQEFVKNWHRQEYPGDPFQVESVEEEKIYAIRRFQLKGGKKVVVYTEVKGDDALATY